MGTLYDSIGEGYTATRAADPRIVERLVSIVDLPFGASILDVGAGTGNYSVALAEAGYGVTALEPSAVMREQGHRHARLEWCEGVAEALPFEDGAFDGAVMTLSMHHFTDWREALRECVRVIGGGPVVIFTFDFEFESEFWLLDYFPSFRVKDAGQFPKMGEIEEMAASLGMGFAMERFPLPADLTDHFAAAGWRRPEMYLEESYRAGISSFASADGEVVAEGVRKLAADLASGMWEERYGELREREVLDVGYLFLRVGLEFD